MRFQSHLSLRLTERYAAVGVGKTAGNRRKKNALKLLKVEMKNPKLRKWLNADFCSTCVC